MYAEKVTETFDANGGYIGDESTAALQTAKGKGHIFRGVEIKSADPRKTPLGWIDQSGTAIPYTTDNYPLYRVNEDTVYTTVWGYDLYIDANGGVFPSVGVDRLKITMEYEGAFSLANAEGLGEAVSYSSKEFLGWATTPDAPEPDIRDGITPVKELDVVYAVWKDGKYYFDEGGNAYLNKQTGDSLGFIIKSREEGKASEIAGVSVDGVPMSEENFTAEGMALSLKNDYLSGLDDGNHTVTVKFADGEVKALFTVGNDNGLPALLPPPAAEFSPVETKSPETQDAPAAVPKANNSKTPYIKPKSNISSSSGKKTTNNTGGKKQSSNTAAEPVQYTVTKGGDGVYIKGGGKYTVVVKRSTDDGNCLDHYIETLIDGDAAEAEVLRGSAVITFDGKTLDKLAAGEHIICAVFDDGTAETSLTVEEKSAEALTTQTNTDGGEKEPLSPSARAGITAGCVTLAALAAYLIRKIIKERKRKKRQEQRLKEREGLSE